MTDYIVMFPADREDEWDAATTQERQEVYDNDAVFHRLLQERGGVVKGGAELSTIRRTHVIRRGPNGTALVTAGPFAESAEQLSGFYRVAIEDEAALLEAAKVLVRTHGAVEIRPVEGT